MSAWRQVLDTAPKKRRVFVSYHHAGDQGAYDALSRLFSEQFEVFTDRSLDDQIDSDNPDYIYRRLREDFIKGSSVTIVLVGGLTAKRKYIDWELFATLDMGHGLLGIQLATAPKNQQGHVIVPDRLHENIQSGFAGWMGWPGSAGALQVEIERAAQRALSKGSLIRNSRPMMSRNAS